MKKIFLIISLLTSFSLLRATENTDSLLKVLDEMVIHHKQYSNEKEGQLLQLKSLLHITTSPEQQFTVCGQLINEYYYYQKDSALAYAKRSIRIANQIHDNNRLVSARIKLASINGSIGLYKEALEIFRDINITKYPNLKVEYYNESAILYGYMGFYAVSDQDRRDYNRWNKIYYDSLISIIPRDTSLYVLAKTGLYFTDNQQEKAFDLLNAAYLKCIDMHDRAKLAYNIGTVYGNRKDTKREMLWLTISSINDLGSATKEYVSLRILAFKLFQAGDIDRAYNYMSCALEDALFCNARLRTHEISLMMPIIDKAYQHQTRTKQQILTISTIVVSVLSLFLLIAIWRVYRQMKKLAMARKELAQVNDHLSDLNERLLENNDSLTEANVIKEEYIVKYMDQCSLYIDKMDEYRRNLQKMVNSGKMEDLLLRIKSKTFIEDEVAEFYLNFDKTFVQLFPDFIEKLNKLLIPSEQIHPKAGQILNLELRIYALIRLGINDSVKIAAFLRCSANTIYNYRTRNRNNAVVHRDSFEEQVMQIGVMPR
jgi:DNA-binding CsgD family transcriptional regulator/cbb3-type cytochrome oxidase subunit 3